MITPPFHRPDWPDVWRLLSQAVCLVLALNLVLLFKDVVILLTVVGAVCYALHRPHQWVSFMLDKWLPGRAPRRFLALALVLAVMGGLVSAVAWTLWPTLRADARQLTQDLPVLFKQVGGSSLTALPEHVWPEVAKAVGEGLAHGVVHGLHAVAGAILVIYLMLDGPRLRQSIRQALPPTACGLLDDSHAILKAAIAELVLVSVFAGLVMTGVYGLLGFKYALLLGLFNGLCHGLPVAGPWLGLLPGLALSLVGPHPEQFGWLLFWAGGLYLFKEYVLLPYVIGNALEIHPVIVMVAFLGSMELFGLWGALFTALPLASLLCAFSLRWRGSEKRGPALLTH